MKRFYLFLTLLSVSTAIFAQNNAVFVNKFFEKHLSDRLEAPSLAKEFKDWPAYQGKKMSTLFKEETEYSEELKRTLFYYKWKINKQYGLEVDTGFMSLKYCFKLVRCNVDVIIDTFRKSMVKHGLESKNVSTTESSSNTGELKTQLDLKSPVNKIYMTKTIESPSLMLDMTRPTQVEIPKIESELVIIDSPVNSKPIAGTGTNGSSLLLEVEKTNKNKTLIAQENEDKEEAGTYRVVDLVDDSIFDELEEKSVPKSFKIIKQEIANKAPLHGRLVNAVNKAPKVYNDPRKMFRHLTVGLMGLNSEKEVKTKHLRALNSELDEYLAARILDEKPYGQYTWFERQLHNSRFKFVRNKLKKKITLQRVIPQDKPWVTVALNVKGIVTAALIEKCKIAKNLRLIRKLHKERKEAVALALLLA